MFNFFKKKKEEKKVEKTQNHFFGFYQDNLEDYIFENTFDENNYDLCLVEYRNSLKKFCIRKIGINNERLIICSGDISKIKCDAVINAARPSLLGGGGVDGAIHSAAGLELVEECRKFGGCDYGEARITNGYNMHVKKIIHAVGPRYQGGINNEAEILKNAYTNAFDLAIENDLKTIAVPAISCGNYGYPTKEGTKIAYDIAMKYLENYPQIRIIFVVNNTIYNEFKQLIE